MGYIAEHNEDAKELAEMLLEYSKVNTLKNNFAQKLPLLASNKDGKVHGSFKITGTETSRLSSKEPNINKYHLKLETLNVLTIRTQLSVCLKQALKTELYYSSTTQP